MKKKTSTCKQNSLILSSLSCVFSNLILYINIYQKYIILYYSLIIEAVLQQYTLYGADIVFCIHDGTVYYNVMEFEM